MSTLLAWLKDAEEDTGEKITHVFMESYADWKEEKTTERQLLTREEFEKNSWATKEFNDGFGGAGCPPLIAWTENYIFSVLEYDGSTKLGVLPRHPSVPKQELYYGDLL